MDLTSTGIFGGPGAVKEVAPHVPAFLSLLFVFVVAVDVRDVSGNDFVNTFKVSRENVIVFQISDGK